MKPVSLIDVASYQPPNRVGREYFERYSRPDDPLLRNPMFRPPEYRHYASREQTGADLIEQAAAAFTDRHGAEALREVDVLLTYNALPDVPFLGSGAEIARRLGCRPRSVVDVHNGHCVVFPYMLDLARKLLQEDGANTALLCVSQNAGKIFTQPGVRTSAHASVPGDGAAVALVAASDESPVLATEVHHYFEYAPDVNITLEDGRLYWEPGTSEMDVGFDNTKAQNVIERGTKILPEVVRALCGRIGAGLDDIDLLVTNQPNRLLLRNWVRELAIDASRQFDTFDSYGNLFGAGVPVSLDHALRADRVAPGSLVVLAGFAGAGEMAAGAAIRWREKA
ncbi:3-oxoacyl-[acyl-carrier-protein] synthase-3 [Saccharopolyspora erythraea NRRL 2338]|uniref:3-oxoacyl-ACP synthase III n=2 Tax=Saccharopolyspora erythraea TaxID=1836 RepID=A4FIG1_SACEN|nr:3-oxoacyl-[acyl-carrier-protein] synthase III C-terminal domain-containing protein [Saccharopolyspora erythraea]PFG97512.1 3-oxoacyl-[acyl-carrier-protein] synthase-3 [Saccharopolyspora erythraea NRRL 2338]QRK87687.1 3-oxoacyl-ACP synthase [Saccharopolyspora erythraea]CAM03836.1 3-oxoacyl-ACP synthase III [Saccharopolyspora erythraea NRRL 2338]